MGRSRRSRRSDQWFCANWRNRSSLCAPTLHSVELIRVAIVDDHPVFAEALAALLDAEPMLSVVATATSLESARRMLDQNRVDVVLLDLDIAGDNGLRLVEERGDNAVRFVVVTALEDPDVVFEAVRRGVMGWVPKEVGIAELVRVIVGVHAGETRVPPRLLTDLLRLLRGIDTESERSRRLISALSPRECEVLKGMMAGMSRDAIAQMLHVSPNTVRTHAQHILHKLHVHTSLGAAAIARSAHLGSD